MNITLRAAPLLLAVANKSCGSCYLNLFALTRMWSEAVAVLGIPESKRVKPIRSGCQTSLVALPVWGLGSNGDVEGCYS